MSSAETNDAEPLVIDQTTNKTTSTEAALILAFVIGFFCIVMVTLYMLRHKELFMRAVSSPKDSNNSSNKRDYVSSNSSFASVELVPVSFKDGALQVVNDGKQRLMFLRGGHNGDDDRYTQQGGYQISDKNAQRRSTPAGSSFRTRRSPNGRKITRLIYADDKVIPTSPQEQQLYYEDYRRSTSYSCEATDFSSSQEDELRFLDQLEDSDIMRMYEERNFRKQADRYNYRPQRHLVIEYPNDSDISPDGRPNFSNWQQTGEEVASTDSFISVYYTPDGQPYRKVQLERVDDRVPYEDVSPTTSSYSAVVLAADQCVGRRPTMQQRHVMNQSRYATSRIEQESGHDISQQVSPKTDVGTVDLALDTPFFGGHDMVSSIITSSSSSEAKYEDAETVGRITAGDTRTPANAQSHSMDIHGSMSYSPNEARQVISYNYFGKDDQVYTGVFTDEDSSTITSEETPNPQINWADSQNTLDMSTDIPKTYRAHRKSIEIYQRKRGLRKTNF